MLKIPQTSHEAFQKLIGIKSQPWEVEKRLWKKVEKYIPPLKLIPGIRMIWVGNSLPMNACHQDSDIDLFIVTRKNRLWSVRIMTTIYFQILWLRKTSKHHAGRFCLSFFVTEDALDFQDIAIENDVYLYFWILYMKPIVDRDDTYEQFLTANTSWCDFDPYQDLLQNAQSRIEIQQNSHRFPQIFSRFWNIVELSLKYIFFPRTKKSFQQLWKPFGVIVSDDMLKFHNRDRREEISRKLL
jgi:hypothetical protein